MKRKKRILIISPHPEGVAPGQRLKYEQYFPFFREAGYEVVVSPFMSDRFWNIVYKPGRYPEKVFWTIMGYFRRFFDLFRLPFYDGIYIFLWVTPFGPPFFERLYGLLNKNILYDIDDLVYLRHSSKANGIIERLKGRDKPIALMKMAKHVIVCTPHLDEFVQQHNPRTTDISSTINTDTYQVVNDYSNERVPVLGWSGSHSTSKYMHLLRKVLLRLQADRPFKLIVMGDTSFHMEGIKDQEAVAWSEAAEVPTLQRFDVGLYPLPNEEWVLGKSGLKALQYMAVGVPVVATAIGANFRVVKHEATGYLVNNEEEWYQALSHLLDDAESRARMGKAARQHVLDHYSLYANKDAYLKALEEVIK